LFALIAPAGTPGAIVQRLARRFGASFRSTPMKRFLECRGIEARDLGPEELKAYIASGTPATAAWCARRACGVE